jgi:hypothetical protein
MPNVDRPRWLVVTILDSLLVGCTPSDSIPPAEQTPETHTQTQPPGLRVDRNWRYPIADRRSGFDGQPAWQPTPQ